MAGKVFFSVTMSLDGYIAPASPDDLMNEKWLKLQQWAFPLRALRERLKIGTGGEERRDNDIVRETFERTGAHIMGKRMFDAGEHAWPEEAPFHTPVFVVTHQKRARPGSGRAVRPSTSSTTASRRRSPWPARQPAIATCGSPAGG